jgi:hypothetical protein
MPWREKREREREREREGGDFRKCKNAKMRKRNCDKKWRNMNANLQKTNEEEKWTNFMCNVDISIGRAFSSFPNS